MHRRSMLWRLLRSIQSSLYGSVNISNVLCPSPLEKSGYLWVSIMHKTSGGRRPKKKIYHRVHELDRVMDLQKKPSLILRLKSIIQSQKNQSLLLRDLEKEVGFVQKWNFMAVIEKYPTIFHVSGGNRTPPMVMLTGKAETIAAEEADARNQMEPLLVRNLRKLLMLSVDCRIPLEKIEFVECELGLPSDFKKSLIPKFPEFFSVKDVNGRAYLFLENWDSSLAATAREERLNREGVLDSSGYSKRSRISKDDIVKFDQHGYVPKYGSSIGSAHCYSAVNPAIFEISPVGMFRGNDLRKAKNLETSATGLVFTEGFSCSQVHTMRSYSTDSGLPPHQEIGMPSLSPMMTEA